MPNYVRTRFTFSLLLCVTLNAYSDEPKAAAPPETASPPATVSPPTVANSNVVTTSPSRGSTSSNGFIWPPQYGTKEIGSDSSAIVQVDVDSDASSSQYASAVASFLTTTPLIERAAKASLGIDPSMVRSHVQIGAIPTGYRFTRIEVRLINSKDKTWQPLDADKLQAALIDGLRTALDESVSSTAKSRAMQEKDIENELDIMKGKLSEIRAVRNRFQEISKNIPGNYRQPEYGLMQAANQLENLEREYDQQSQQMAVFEPVLNAISEREQLLKLREEKLEQMKKENRPADEIRELELQVAESKSNLETLRASDGRSGFPNSSAIEMNRLLTNRKSMEKQIQALKTGIKVMESKEYQELAGQQQLLQQSEQHLQGTIRELMSRKENIERQFRRTSHYRVTVLDGEPDTSTNESEAPAVKKE